MPLDIEPSLNVPQARFLAMPQKFRAFVAGFGTGKTWTGCASLAKQAWEFPRITSGYFAPSYPQIRDIFFPTIEEVLYDWGLNCEIRTSDKEVHIYRGKQYRSTVICRSMDNPGSIIGFKIGHAIVDELDTMQTEKARHAWRKIIARMRYKSDGLKNSVDVTTTPEGFRFTHERFVQSVQSKPELASQYGLLHASTYDNAANLPDDYISSLEADYPEQLISAYLRGQFVNLTSGTVYSEYSRERHRSYESIKPGEDLHIGQDFNVGHMSSTIYVVRPDGWHMVGELVDILDTPALIETIRSKFAGHVVYLYPDASGDSRKTVNASKSDIALLEQSGFKCRYNPSNPHVRDRILSVNSMFKKNQVRVNDSACPYAVKALEQQCYDKNGEPDKSTGVDHAADSLGYPIVYNFPINKPVIHVPVRFAM